MADATGWPLTVLPAGDAQAKYWIDADGRLELVAVVGRCNTTHEDWACERLSTLERLFEWGWIRVQFMPPIYLYVDFGKPVNEKQHPALALLLFKENHDIPFRDIVVEFAGAAVTFHGNQAAFAYLVRQGERSWPIAAPDC